MKTEEWKGQLMDYLYDEMEIEERKIFEAELAKNPALRKELEALQHGQAILSQLKDEDVSAPPFFNVHKNEIKLQQSTGLKWFMAVAASLLLLMVAGKFTGLEISNADGKFRMAFDQEKQLDETIREQEVKELISNALVSYEEKLETKRTEEMDSFIATNRAENKKLINNYLKAMENSNAEMMQAYWEESNQHQKVYMENLLTDFAGYMQKQRKDDMDYLFAKMELMESDKDLFKLETGQILNTLASNNGQETAY
ncbi:hypothetical protein JKA74_09245 [Marivirga sp. S37H4]|uniref:Zinc-finger domain-containing protein n=1 Tax=Marivirga aurantiaca TaxID=2802615 RepID=A0A934WXZ6_9BACT|nr:hypothetical protein [Marivirga aurantiaca]MBK6265223.1 hypothetical protein [Marivirga aurantiaca]